MKYCDKSPDGFHHDSPTGETYSVDNDEEDYMVIYYDGVCKYCGA